MEMIGHKYPRTLPASFTYDQIREHYVHMRTLLTESQREEWDKIAIENQGALSPESWYSALHYYRLTMEVIGHISQLHKENDQEMTDEEIRSHIAWDKDSTWRDRWLKAKNVLHTDLDLFYDYQKSYQDKDWY